MTYREEILSLSPIAHHPGGTMPNGHTIFLDDSIDVFTLPRRPYDFSKGDRRFFTLEQAMEHAEAEAGRTSVRQVVRKDSSPNFTGKLYLVQAVGS